MTGKALQTRLPIATTRIERPLAKSKRELVRRAGTYLSIQQQISARRRSKRAEERGNDGAAAPDVQAIIAKALRRMT